MRRRYVLSPSMLNKFTGWLNSEEDYWKYWGNSETPKLTLAEYQQQQQDELIFYLQGDPQPPMEAADRGTCLNEIVDCLIGAIPREDVTWAKEDISYTAQLNGFSFKFYAQLVDDTQMAMRNGIPQFHLKHLYKPDGVDYEVLLHGYSDYIFPTQIWDLKTTLKYDGEKYANNWQRHVYPMLAVDEGDMISCETFGFHVVELRKDSASDILNGRTWRETYDVNIDESRAKVLEFVTMVVVPQINEWIMSGQLDMTKVERRKLVSYV